MLFSDGTTLVHASFKASTPKRIWTLFRKSKPNKTPICSECLLETYVEWRGSCIEITFQFVAPMNLISIFVTNESRISP